MSVFTSRVTKVLEVPHDPGQSVTIRKLAPRHLEQAAKAQQVRSLDNLREMGGSAFIKELQDLTSKPEQDVEVDPVTAFDRVTVIETGVLAWSYDSPLTRDVFEDLDDETAAWLAREILLLAKPSLLRSPEDAEAATKNAARSYTAH